MQRKARELFARKSERAESETLARLKDRPEPLIEEPAEESRALSSQG